MRMADTEKIIKYSTIGLGALLIGYAIFGAKRAHAQYAKRLSKFTRRKGVPKLLPLGGAAATSNEELDYPALMMHYQPDRKDYVFGILNFTPRRLSDAYDTNLVADQQFFQLEPYRVSDSVENIYRREDFHQFAPRAAEMIHPVDYTVLQAAGFIPPGFPISQTAYVKSFNGINDFLVGYSSSFNTTGSRGAISVIRPEWAVSFGTNFNPSSNPSEQFAKTEDPAEFRDMAERMLYAEFLLSNSGVNGCHPNQERSMCDMERNALLGLMMERLDIKRAKHDDSTMTWYDVFQGDGIKWNGGGLFMSSFNGYADCHRCSRAKQKAKTCPKDSCCNWREFKPLKKALPERVQNRFDDYYGSSFWQLPRLASDGTNFFHPASLSTHDKAGKALAYTTWMKGGLPMPANEHKHPNNYPILIGKSIITDRGGRFK